MPERIKGTSPSAKNVGKPRPLFIHGKLLPVEAEYREWADKDANKNKIEGTGGVRTYAEWVRLPEGKRGQKWFIAIDQRMFRPDFETPTTRGIMVDFPEWQQFVLPGILDAVGKGEQSVQEFLNRADAETWFAEAELVHSGFYLDKPQNTIKFTRMTQSETEIRAWHKERYPKGEETEVPEDQLRSAKFIWVKMAKQDKDIFNTTVNNDPELSPYLTQFAANDYALVKG